MAARTPLTTRTGCHVVDEGHTLAGEHARLMRDLTRHTEPVSALLGARTWPHAELGTLTTFLRTAVLRQVSDEEVHLFPHDSSAPPFAELSADHVRLHALTARLEQVRVQPCPPTVLRAIIDELLTTLRRHQADELAVFAALPDTDDEVPAVAELTAADRGWLPTDDAPLLIEVDRLPADQASELCIERLLRLRAGQRAELHAHDDRLLWSVGRWLRDFDAARFALVRVTAGHDHLLRITCRAADAPAGIGYPG